MESNYKKLSQYIREVSNKNSDLQVKRLLGVSVNKVFIPSIANIVGTDLRNYKIVLKNQFAYGPVTSRNSDKISIALLDEDECIISTSYTVFEIIDTNELLPEYLMMWFRREEFDRYARYMSHGSVREIFGWEEMGDVEIPVPDIEIQKEIVKEYNTIINRIELNNQLIQKLEETAQTIYKQWFVDFEFPDKNGNPYKSSGGEMEYCEELEKEIPKHWRCSNLNECITFINGFAFKSESMLDFKDENSLDIFKLGNIKKGGGLVINGTKTWINKKHFSKIENYILKKGDVVMAMTDMKDNIGILGNTALIFQENKFVLNQRVGLLRIKNNLNISYPYIYLLTNSTDFLNDLRSRANRGVQVNLTSLEIKNSKMIIAPNKVNSIFNKKINVFFDRLFEAQLELELLENFKQILLSKMSKIPVEVVAK